jgi:hypothetical protein
MGNDNSAMLNDGVPTRKLKSRDVKGVAEHIKTCRRIVVMVSMALFTLAAPFVLP